MSVSLKTRIKTLRKPVEEFLIFYSIDGPTLGDNELMNQLITRITNYRAAAYGQNREFELMLGQDPTGLNEEANIINWNKILLIYETMMPKITELLDGVYVRQGLEKDWLTLKKQALTIIVEIDSTKRILETIVGTSIDKDGILEIINEIKIYLQFTTMIYDDIIAKMINLKTFVLDTNESKLGNIRTYITQLEIIVSKDPEKLELLTEIQEWFHKLIKKYVKEPSKDIKENFDVTKKIINTLELQIKTQEEQIKKFQELKISEREWKNLALSLINTTVDYSKDNIL